ncbi:MAG: hypothetical protein GX330_05810 [Bacteroidales bacterium]|nr:hypothetical protein [Bacteroidales bacterium]
MNLDGIMKSLYYKKETYFLDMFAKVKHNKTTLYNDRNNCVSEKHIEKWLLINDLLNICVYLNKDWTPNWENKNEIKYILVAEDDRIKVEETIYPISFAYFKTKDLANNAIEILGKDALYKILKGEI